MLDVESLNRLLPEGVAVLFVLAGLASMAWASLLPSLISSSPSSGGVGSLLAVVQFCRPGCASSAEIKNDMTYRTTYNVREVSVGHIVYERESVCRKNRALPVSRSRSSQPAFCAVAFTARFVPLPSVSLTLHKAFDIMRIPRVYLGTMTFGWGQSSSPVDASVASEMLKLFHDAGHSYVDTARIYSGGTCEAIMGQAVVQSKVDGTSGFKFGSKAHPSQGSLTPACVEEQLTKSLAESGLEAFDEYYLHSPDGETPLLDSLTYLHSQVVSGKVRKMRGPK